MEEPHFDSNVQPRVDIIGKLKPEISRMILQKLPQEDIRQAWNCSNKWRTIMDDDSFWKTRYQKDFSECLSFIHEYDQPQIFRELPDRYGCWQSAYFCNIALSFNWKHRLCQVQRKKIALKVDEAHLCCGPCKGVFFGLRGKICYYDDINGPMQILLTLDRSEAVKDLRVYGNLLFIIVKKFEQASNALLAVDIERRQLSGRLKVSESSIKKNVFSVYNNSFCVALDSTLWYYAQPWMPKLWEAPGKVKRLHLFKNLAAMLITGDQNGLWIINFHNGDKKQLKMNCCRFEEILNIRADEQHLASLCYEGHLCTWDIERGLKLGTRKPGRHIFESYYFIKYDRIVYPAPTHCFENRWKKLRVMNALKLEHLFDIQDTNDMNHILANNYYIFTSSDKFYDTTPKMSSCTIFKMWSKHTGQFIRLFDIQYYDMVDPSNAKFYISDAGLRVVFRSSEKHGTELINCFFIQSYDFNKLVQIEE